jgi:hypothetical protein
MTRGLWDIASVNEKKFMKVGTRYHYSLQFERLTKLKGLCRCRWSCLVHLLPPEVSKANSWKSEMNVIKLLKLIIGNCLKKPEDSIFIFTKYRAKAPSIFYGVGFGSWPTPRTRILLLVHYSWLFIEPTHSYSTCPGWLLNPLTATPHVVVVYWTHSQLLHMS